MTDEPNKRALYIEQLPDKSYQLYEVELSKRPKKRPLGPSSLYEVVFGRIREEGYRLWHFGGADFPKRKDDV